MRWRGRVDTEAERIGELVSEACELLQQAERGRRGPEFEAELEYVRARLVVLAASTSDAESADAACGAASEIAGALSGLDDVRGSRAA
jgi:hypothetical protein